MSKPMIDRHPYYRTSHCAALWVLALACGVLLATDALPTEALALRSRQEAQERARGLARELSSGILDVQLTQLQENGLSELAIYRDIQSMRDNLNGLIDLEMARVVELLVEAQSAEATARNGFVDEARKVIREVVLKLSLERHNLLRRLKTADLAAQTKRLIELESRALDLTLSLASAVKERQEVLAISAVNDQRDVKALFANLVAALVEVSTWGGPAGEGAAGGLRVLEASRVAAELELATTSLEVGNYAAAASGEQRVLRGLRLLLSKIEEAQGLIGSDLEAALQLVAELERRQTDLVEHTRAADLNESGFEKLVEEELAIHKDLGRLEASLERASIGEAMLHKARQAAVEAGSKLLEAQKAAALQEETKVLGALAELAKSFRDAAETAGPDHATADDARRAQALEQAVKSLAGAEKLHAQAVQLASTDAPKAAGAEAAAAEAAQAAASTPGLPEAASAVSREAAQAAQASARALSDPQAGSDRGKKLEATREAIERARGEVEAALARAAKTLASQPSGAQGKAPHEGQGAEPGAGEKGEGKVPAQQGQGQAGKRVAAAKGGGGDAPGADTSRNEPWVLKLPPELRAAVQSQSRRPPPRGYEERLRRYFESLDGHP